MAKNILEVVKSPKDFGSINISLSDFPEAKEYKVGHKCDLIVKVELIGINKDGYSGSNTEVRLKVLKVKEYEDGKDD